MSWSVRQGDCVALMAAMDAASVDAVVCDPPSGISFMGKSWDHDRGGMDAWVEWLSGCLAEALRVAKPGAHALVWALPRTSHWTGLALERAGWEVRDVVTHLFGSGFPKSHDVSKGIDRSSRTERQVVGRRTDGVGNTDESIHKREGFAASREPKFNVTAPATLEASAWEGWGTALKPAAEFWFLARKPFDGTVSANVLKHGTGALNIDGCRIAGAPDPASWTAHRTAVDTSDGRLGQKAANIQAMNAGLIDAPSGRWPANVTLDEDAAAQLDEQSGELTSGSGTPFNRSADKFRHSYGAFQGRPAEQGYYGDTGGASRFFYCAKPSRAERNAGLDGFEAKPSGKMEDDAYQWATDGHGSPRGPKTVAANVHPTVKPISLMRWLVRLVTPPDGLVLDPFTGSGTTGCAAVLEHFDFIGIEREPEYVEIARARIAWWAEHPEGIPLDVALHAERKRVEVAASGQDALF